jgi:hypothetical protein
MISWQSPDRPESVAIRPAEPSLWGFNVACHVDGATLPPTDAGSGGSILSTTAPPLRVTVRRSWPRSLAVTGLVIVAVAGCAAPRKLATQQPIPTQSVAETELRRNTQDLLDAVAPGNRAVWDRLLDSAVIQVDENDVVHGKAEILAGLEPLPTGLVGNLAGWPHAPPRGT